jgi:hypothetical protein
MKYIFATDKNQMHTDKYKNEKDILLYRLSSVCI